MQEEGIDCGNTLAPTCRIGSQRVLLATAYQHDWPVYQVHGQVSFLQSKLKCDTFLQVATEHEMADHKAGVPMVVKLKRSLHWRSQ